MKKVLVLLFAIVVVLACSDESTHMLFENPRLNLEIPKDFPDLNTAVASNFPTEHGVALGQTLFNDKRLSGNNTISCASCHHPSKAFTDGHPQAIGIYERVGLRNTPALQNLAFMKSYNWDGNISKLENQTLVPIITHEEMNSSILEVIGKIEKDKMYTALFTKAFGDQEITAERIYSSLVQYQYTLISANSKYDRVKRKEAVYSEEEKRGYEIFQSKCENCHSGALFTDQSFRNIGFPINGSSEEAGRARVTGKMEDYMRFRVPSLRNVGYTAPYGSFGQFATLKDVLDYFDKGVLNSDNLDPMLKDNGNRIPLSESEKEALIAFMLTLSDEDFVEE